MLTGRNSSRLVPSTSGAVWQAGDNARRWIDLAARWSDAVSRLEALDRADLDDPKTALVFDEIATECAALDKLEVEPRDEGLAAKMQGLVQAEMSDRWASQ